MDGWGVASGQHTWPDPTSLTSLMIYVELQAP